MAQTDVIGSHNLSLAGSAPALSGIGSCAYCHAPHSGLNGKAGAMPTPLWNQALSQVASYPLYSSATMQNLTNGALTLGTESTLCLSCHDGTVALGATAAYGQVPVGTLSSQDNLGTNLSTIHPFNFVLNNGQFTCFSTAQSSLCANPPATANPAVPLINGNIQCTSCHNPHVQYADPAGNFLVVNNTSGALCLACHSTVPTGTGMRTLNVRRTTAGVMASTTAGVMEHNTNPLAGWRTSMHALATNRVTPQVSLDDSAAGPTRTGSRRSMSLGPYGTVSKNACSSCHASHNAQGGGSLLRAPDDQTCIVCHNGSSNTSPPSPNILAEMVAPRNGHAFSTGDTLHRVREAALLNQNRHVGCVDCHNPHSTGRVTNFAAAPTVRASQAQVIGISAADGRTVVSPAADQYENCLRCHGTSNGKKATINYGYLPLRVVAAPDPLDVIPEFNSLAASSHPVFRDRRSMFPQPSLRLNMLNLDGKTPGRLMGTRMMCTDCHNSDDNREFGGNGPNGPHGSIFQHILERRYEFNRAAIPGRVVTNLFPFPDLSAQGGASGGPYALCAKCHDLRQVMNTTSFTEHARHVQQDGFSCSVCHTAHGMGAQSEGISGERLVNFDGNIVAPEGSAPISYDRATNSCSLVCHNHVHKGPSKLSISAFRR
ncbi:MAG TPA: cytochrome c3 family protein [Terriglobia bacterium]|nr:cytochrome c3 family protein [Terriglobia bacterium]